MEAASVYRNAEEPPIGCLRGLCRAAATGSSAVSGEPPRLTVSTTFVTSCPTYFDRLLPDDDPEEPLPLDELEEPEDERLDDDPDEEERDELDEDERLDDEPEDERLAEPDEERGGGESAAPDDERREGGSEEASIGSRSSRPFLPKLPDQGWSLCSASRTRSVSASPGVSEASPYATGRNASSGTSCSHPSMVTRNGTSGAST